MSLLAKQVGEYLRWAEGVLQFSRECAIADELVKRFETSSLYCDVGLFGVKVILQDMLSLEEVKPILEYLAKEHGMLFRGKAAKMSSTAGWVWHFSESFRLEAKFKNAPEASCRMVKVGEKQQTVDILEMQCDEPTDGIGDDIDEALEEAAAAFTEDHDPNELGQEGS